MEAVDRSRPQQLAMPVGFEIASDRRRQQRATLARASACSRPEQPPQSQQTASGFSLRVALWSSRGAGGVSRSVGKVDHPRRLEKWTTSTTCLPAKRSTSRSYASLPECCRPLRTRAHRQSGRLDLTATARRFSEGVPPLGPGLRNGVPRLSWSSSQRVSAGASSPVRSGGDQRVNGVRARESPCTRRR